MLKLMFPKSWGCSDNSIKEVIEKTAKTMKKCMFYFGLMPNGTIMFLDKYGDAFPGSHFSEQL